MSGIFGIVSENDCNELLLLGTDYHSHLGTEYGGMAILGDDFVRHIRNINQTQFKSKFFEDFKEFKGNMGIGVISAFDEQPIYINSKFGPFCLVTNGIVENLNTLATEMMEKGVTFSEVGKGEYEVNETELIAKMIAMEDNLLSGIEKIFERIEGSCSLLLLNRDGIYAARDRFGYSPLIIGERDDAIAVTSETNAFPNTDFEIVKNLGPGEIVLISKEGLKPCREGGEKNQICSFLWIYTGFPASSYENINAEQVRERCGAYLARRDTDVEIDLAAGVPDSGTAHGLGYAMEAGKPFRRPLVKYTAGYGRSYTPPDQATRDLIAKMKLIPIKEVIEGNRVVICEDSIVRGTQLKNFTITKLLHCGAKEIHVRVACPPLMFPCKFNFSTRTTGELAARKAIQSLEGTDIDDVSDYLDHTSDKYQKMVEWIKQDLDVTTLRYQTLDDMVSAIGLPKDKLCTYCWTGKYYKP
jgi:amidophosphoribosyltransferase